MAEGLAHQPRRRRHSNDFLPPDMSMRLVMVGKTGAGKSSSGNTILGKNAFPSSVSASSVTRQCCKTSGLVGGRELTLVDTPGLFDTALTDKAVQREVSKCVNMSCPGPHAILLVIRMGPFTQEEQGAVERVESIFGPGAWRHTIVLFTHADRSSLTQALKDAPPELKNILGRVSNRYHMLNNNRADDRTQVLDLLEKVEKMVRDNKGEYYSNPTYVEVNEMLAEREKELRARYSVDLQTKMEALEQKYKLKLTEAQNDVNNYQEELRRKQREVNELVAFFQYLQSSVRSVVEEIVPSDSIDKANFHRTLSHN